MLRRVLFAALIAVSSSCFADIVTVDFETPDLFDVPYDYNHIYRVIDREERPGNVPVYTYQGLLWERLGIMSVADYPTNGYGKGDGDFVGYGDLGDWLTISALTGSHFTFIQGDFIPAHYYYGSLVVEATMEDGTVLSNRRNPFGGMDFVADPSSFALTTITWQDIFGENSSPVELVKLAFRMTTNLGDLIPGETRGAQVAFDNFVLDITSSELDDATVPEPATLAIFGLGIAGVGIGAYRRKR